MKKTCWVIMSPGRSDFREDAAQDLGVGDVMIWPVLDVPKFCLVAKPIHSLVTPPSPEKRSIT